MEYQFILLCISWLIPEGQSLMKLPKLTLLLLLIYNPLDPFNLEILDLTKKLLLKKEKKSIMLAF